MLAALTVAGLRWIQAVEVPPSPVSVQAPVAVEILRIQPAPYTHRLEALGTVRAIREAALGPEVSGPVLEVPPEVELGKSVRKGSLIARIDPAPFEIEVKHRNALLLRARAELQRAEGNRKHQQSLIAINREKLRLAEAEWERLKGLFRNELTPQQDMERAELSVRRAQEELERAESALEEAKGQEAIARANVTAAEVELERARKTLQDTGVRAPFDGVISEKMVTEGEMVSPGSVLVRLVDHDTVKIQIRVPAEDIASLSPGLPAEVRVNEIDSVFRGRVAYVGPSADTQTRTFPVEVVVKNDGATPLLPGMFARLQIPLKTYPSAVLIPRASVLPHGNRQTIFVVDPDKRTAARRIIRIRRTFGSLHLVDQGLRPGDLLVVTGQHQLQDGASVKVIAQNKGNGARNP